jgi:hypothetical protein
MILLDASLRATLVVAIVALLLAALRVRSSAVRHAAWTVALAGMLLMPALTRLMPGVEVRIPAAGLTLAPAVERQLPPAERPIARPGAPAASASSAAPLPSPAAPAAPADSASALDWYGLAALVYALIGGALLARLGIGWMRARTISRSGIPCGEFFESSWVAAPVTIGVLAPRIVLPIDWRRWTSATLDAVLLHERTHIRRHDPLVALAARVNCCVFWFHPLAWWLDRTLAATAEQACDDAAVRATGDPRGYALVLVEQADAVRRHGRLAWHGVGMSGPRLLHHRVDRVLQGTPPDDLSRLRKLAIAAACVAAVIAVAACRRQGEPPPLREDPEVAQTIARQNASLNAQRAAMRIGPAEAAALEAALAKNPGDAEARSVNHRLGEIYAMGIMGITDRAYLKRDPAQALAPFAAEARKKLDASRNVALLTAAGTLLTTRGQRTPELDETALGRSYLERAVEIDPKTDVARRVLANDRWLAAHAPLRARIREKQIELAGVEIARKIKEGGKLSPEEQQALTDVEDDAVATLPEADRLAVLPGLADLAYMRAESIMASDNDRARAEASWARSKKYAEEALALARKLESDPDRGTAIYRANVALATHALREGNRKGSVRYMLQAVEAPPSEQLDTTQLFGLEQRLVHYLLKAGERDTVVEFLERSALLRSAERERLARDAAAIRRGVMPPSYQHMMTRSKS